MAKKKEKKQEEEGVDWIAMAEESIKPEYEANAS